MSGGTCDECRPDKGNDRGYITIEEIERLVAAGVPVFIGGSVGIQVRRVFHLPAAHVCGAGYCPEHDYPGTHA